MLKKTMVALAALLFAVVLAAPAKANAQVAFGVGVRPVAVRHYGYGSVGYGSVVVSPYVAAPAPYVAIAPGYAYSPYVYPGAVVVGGGWYPRAHAYRGYGWRGYGWRR